MSDENKSNKLSEVNNVPENKAPLIMIIGKGESTDAAQFFEVYDPTLNKSFHYDIMPKTRKYFKNIAATVMDDELIVAGGFEENALNEVYKLNLTTMTWSQLPPMLRARFDHRLSLLQHKIYAVGGCPLTNTVECWDPTTTDWKFVTEMSTKRFEHCVIELNNKLYALGGWDGNGITSSVECYDANLDKWTTKASMNKKRKTFSVGILNDILYAIGGDTFGNCIERYDAKADKWILLHNFDGCFGSLKCISLHQCFIGTCNSNGSMEIVKYDPVKNELIALHTLKKGIQGRSQEVLIIPHIMLNKFQ